MNSDVRRPAHVEVEVVHDGVVDRPDALQHIAIAPNARLVLPGSTAGASHLDDAALVITSDIPIFTESTIYAEKDATRVRRVSRPAEYRSIAVTARILIAVAIIVVAGGGRVVARTAARRRAVPTQGRAVVPQQLDRHDFARPEAPWLVVLFTSRALRFVRRSVRQGQAARVRRRRRDRDRVRRAARAPPPLSHRRGADHRCSSTRWA